MAEPEDSRPVKGILKNSTSFDHDGGKDAAQAKREREMKWDEMNILATYHPADKDYGHNKIDEPPTPYNKLTDEDVEHSGGEQEGENSEEVDPQSLASRLVAREGEKRERTISSGTEEEEDEAETEEDRAKKKMFEQKRKMHYNEFQAVKLARQLVDEDEEEEEEEEEEKEEAAKDESTAL